MSPPCTSRQPVDQRPRHRAGHGEVIRQLPGASLRAIPYASASGVRLQEAQDHAEDDSHRPGWVDDGPQVRVVSTAAGSRRSASTAVTPSLVASSARAADNTIGPRDSSCGWRMTSRTSR